MTQEYINPIPDTEIKTIEVEDHEQKTPKRITIEYQTTGKFENIGEKNREQSGKSNTR